MELESRKIWIGDNKARCKDNTQKYFDHMLTNTAEGGLKNGFYLSNSSLNYLVDIIKKNKGLTVLISVTE